MASGAESVTLADRTQWLQDEFPRATVGGVACDAPLDLYDDAVWEAQVAAIRSALRVAGVGAPDVVVAGEEYGRRLAGYFGAAFEAVDRTEDMVSGRAVRSDLAGHWEDLAPAVRAGLACRVVVVGAESSGTTTVARALADRYRAQGGVWGRTAVVNEYGRTYTEELWKAQRVAADREGRPAPDVLDVVWTSSDFDVIADRQTADEDRAARSGSPLLVCDTDAFATAIWRRRYLPHMDAPPSRPSPDWARPPRLPRHDLYLLTDHEGVPWVDDGLREGELDVRAAMTAWFADALTAAGHPWVFLTGDIETRLRLAERSVEAVLERRLQLSDPLSGPGFPRTDPRSRPAAGNRSASEA